MKDIDKETKQAVYNYHTELHQNDRGYGGPIHKRVRERFNLTSDQVIDIIREISLNKLLKEMDDENNFI